MLKYKITTMQFSFMKSRVHWYCHFKLATYILESFSDMAYNFIMYAGVTSNGLSIIKNKNVANNRACCWSSTDFKISVGLSSKNY